LLRNARETPDQVGAHQRTFTVFFPDQGYDERRFAKAVVDRIGAAAHWISFTDQELLDVLPSVVESQDEPFGSSSIVAQWFVMREAKRAGMKVMLDGQGGDETLLGYPTTFGYRFADLLAGGRLLRLKDEIAGYRTAHGTTAAATAVALATPFLPARARWLLRARRDHANRILHEDLRGRAPTPERTVSPFPERLRRQYHLILAERGLPELLRYEDRNSMAHSIEARVPFLDYRLVELLYAVQASELVDRGVTKSVLRRALGDVLPPSVRNRIDKLGFVTPGVRFLREGLGAYAADLFASRRFAERGFVDAGEARKRLAEIRAGVSTTDGPVWRAVNLELWARTFLD
jgi:asparagine synthase (glutamine-hydrolysing)